MPGVVVYEPINMVTSEIIRYVFLVLSVQEVDVEETVVVES